MRFHETTMPWGRAILGLPLLLFVCNFSGCSPAEADRTQTQRIISLAPSTTEILFTLGLDDRLVGVTRYCDYPAATSEIAKVGGYVDPNYEAIAALAPDLIVLLKEHKLPERHFRDQGLTVVALSDSPASPIIRAAQHGFVVAADTPQFFPSSVATIALLETLLSFVIAVASDEIVARVERFHKRRHQLGIYLEEPE